ncbi:MAG TPA: GTP cyclohydrolase I [Candidatus Polarisedimenticolia bacterium]|nr:GTP cyclohydrolase I [Candidatus Polarisedimenticolia bacterium]
MSRDRRPASGGRRRAALNRNRMLRGARLFLTGIDEPDLKRDLRRTPARVADAWSRDILSGYGLDPLRILATGSPTRERDMVVVHGIRFVSVCVHHLLPFYGSADVAYLPQRRLVGLSKIARVVDALAHRLQLQERLTRQITESIAAALQPRGVACRMEAEHLCMTIRGTRKRSARVVTTAWRGRFARSAALRSEFLRLSGSVAGAAARRRRGASAGA